MSALPRMARLQVTNMDGYYGDVVFVVGGFKPSGHGDNGIEGEEEGNAEVDCGGWSTIWTESSVLPFIHPFIHRVGGESVTVNSY